MAEDYGIKVSNIGTDINSTNKSDYVFNSSNPILKTLKVAVVNYSFSSNATNAEVDLFNHNTGTRYLAWVSIVGTKNEWQTTNRWGTNDSIGFGRSWKSHATDQKLSMVYQDYTVPGGGTDDFNETGEDWSFKYYIFNEPIRPFV